MIIFDEGHNIEDVCRSSVGYEATQFQLGEAILNLEDVIKKDKECFNLNPENPEQGLEIFRLYFIIKGQGTIVHLGREKKKATILS